MNMRDDEPTLAPKRPKCPNCGSGMDAWGCVKCGNTKRPAPDIPTKVPTEDKLREAIKETCDYYGLLEVFDLRTMKSEWHKDREEILDRFVMEVWRVVYDERPLVDFDLDRDSWLVFDENPRIEPATTKNLALLLAQNARFTDRALVHIAGGFV